MTPSDVAFLLGVSVTTVYRCFYSGTLKAVRLRRKTYVRREDLDKYFEEAGAYKKKSYKRKDDQEYYTLREIMEKYNIGRKAVWGRCDRLGIPKVYVGRNTFFSKKAVDAKFADLLEEIDLDNYYTMNQVMEMYGMTRTNAMSFVTYHKVPRVNRNGKAYYSKIHIDSIKQKGNEVDPDWYTYEEISEKYGLTKDQISYTLKNYDVRTEKRGKFTMIYRTDFDKITQQRMGNTKKVENLDGTERVIFQPKAQERACPPTPEGYYSTEEVAEMFKITIKHVGVMTRENKTPKIALKNFNFYEKKAIDILYNQKHKYADINDWITLEEMRDTYKMTHDAVRSFIHRHKIPSKVEYGVTYYSKQHIQALKTGYFEGRERYYSVEEAMKKYGMTKDILRSRLLTRITANSKTSTTPTMNARCTPSHSRASSSMPLKLNGPISHQAFRRGSVLYAYASASTATMTRTMALTPPNASMSATLCAMSYIPSCRTFGLQMMVLSYAQPHASTRSAMV